jgi:hypothetical protein
MAEIARRPEQSSGHLGHIIHNENTVLARTIDPTIQLRIRSLLLSRNDHFSPTTPHNSRVIIPGARDYLTATTPSKNRASPAIESLFDVSGSSDIDVDNMVSSRFGDSSRYPRDNSWEGLRSRLERLQDEFDGNSSLEVPNFQDSSSNHKTIGAAIGREHMDPVAPVKPMLADKIRDRRYSSRIPRHVLRTLIPTPDKEDAPFDTSATRLADTDALASVNLTPAEAKNEPQDACGFERNATLALRHVEAHQIPLPSDDDQIQTDIGMPVADDFEHEHHPLLQTMASQRVSTPLAEPVLTDAETQGQSYFPRPKTVPMDADSQKKLDESVIIDRSARSASSPVSSASGQRSSHSLPRLGRSRAAKILARLPPFRKETIEGIPNIMAAIESESSRETREATPVYEHGHGFRHLLPHHGIHLGHQPRHPTRIEQSFEGDLVANLELQMPVLDRYGMPVAFHESTENLCEHADNDLMPLVPRPLSTIGRYSDVSISATSSQHARHTAHRLRWIRDMLNQGSPRSGRSEGPHLTARPFHRRKYAKQSSNEAILHGYQNVDGGRIERPASSDVYTQELPQACTINTEIIGGVIGELETLLREALTIAHRAAEKDEQSQPPMIFVQKPTEPNSVKDDHRKISDFHLVKKRTASDPIGAGESFEPSNVKMARQLNNITIVKPEPSWKASNVQMPKSYTPYPGTSAAQSRNVSLLPPNIMDEDTPEPQVKVQDWVSNVEISKDTPRTALQSVTYPDAYPLTPRTDSKPSVTRRLPESRIEPLPTKPTSAVASLQETYNNLFRERSVKSSKKPRMAPPIQPRTSSAGLRADASAVDQSDMLEMNSLCSLSTETMGDCYVRDIEAAGVRERGSSPEKRDTPQQHPGIGPGALPPQDTITSIRGPSSLERSIERSEPRVDNGEEYNLRGRHHFSIRVNNGFSLRRSHRRALIARDWSASRKRCVAAVACLNTMLVGLIIGIYAGEVPAIQYAIYDENHYVIIGNVVFYIGLALPTALFFPLPLLHGRKPYTLGALTLLMPLQFPQAVAVAYNRDPGTALYRTGILLSRAAAGFVMGFANFNFFTTLLDLFGSSLQSGNPHQETVNENDVRRHGGGMGVWLGIWTFCSIGSLGVGFVIGALIISGLNVSWGFWVTIILTVGTLLLNVITPEVRRSAYRRSMAEVLNGTEVSRRIARGEVKMHLYATGPLHWWEEVLAGHVLCFRMLKQPGFVVLALYQAWVYAQMVMVIILLGALTSRYYLFQPQYVAACVGSLPLGSLIAVPFQKASFFSRARHHAPRTDSMTFQKRVTWTSHLVRRASFMILLPFAGLAYTLSSGGPPTPVALPCIFAAVIGFLSNLAIAECNGIMMETFDTSDLQPGMTGRPRRVVPEDVRRKRTNFSCFPRVTAAFMITQTGAYFISAAATGTGGRIERTIGAQAATGIVAFVLLVLTLLLIAVLTRWKVVQIVPTHRVGTRVLAEPGSGWMPVIIGNPSGTTRRLSILEMGAMTRWAEVRRRNRLFSGFVENG